MSGRGARIGLIPFGTLLLWGTPAPAAAQVDASRRFTNAAANGAIGGVVAFARALVRRESPWRPVAAGFGGGVLMSAGKQIAGARFSGAGLAGRQLAAAGIAVVRSASGDTAVFAAPLGPVTLEVRPRARDRVRARVNVVDALSVAGYALTRDARFDAGASLSAGAPVFRRPRARISPRSADAEGYQHTGTIVLAREPPQTPELGRFILPHESVHVLQGDALGYLVTLPAERALLARIPHGDRVARAVDVGVLAPLAQLALSSRIRYDRRPWEREAYVLTQGRPEPPATAGVMARPPSYQGP